MDSQVETALAKERRKRAEAALAQASRVQGVFEGQQMARVFAWMRPNDLIWNYWVNTYLIGNVAPSFDVLYWNNDTTRLPARWQSGMLDIALSNPFTHPGAITLLGTPIDRSKVRCDASIMAGVTTQHLGGTCEFVLSCDGHSQKHPEPTRESEGEILHRCGIPG